MDLGATAVASIALVADFMIRSTHPSMATHLHTVVMVGTAVMETDFMIRSTTLIMVVDLVDTTRSTAVALAVGAVVMADQ